MELNKHDTVRRKHDPPRGVLRAGDRGSGFVHARYWPSPDLAPFVEHYWTVEWNLDRPCVRETLPHPVVHIVLEGDEATLTGPTTRRFTVELKGKGRVFGVKFHPGGFRPFTGGPVSAYADRTIALERVFGAAARGLAPRALASADHTATIAELETFLRARGARADAASATMARIAACMAAEREIMRIEQVAQRFGIGLRSLQRQFRDYVGVPPKWVIQRYRLHEALARIDESGGIDWPALALDLGYADQAHLIRDFKRIVGCTPARYARVAKR